MCLKVIPSPCPGCLSSMNGAVREIANIPVEVVVREMSVGEEGEDEEELL